MNIADKLTTIAKNVPKVYEAGQKSEYDRFWDIYQDNGEKKKYPCAFGGYGWNEETLKPKYSIKATETYMMFAYCGYTGDLDDVFKNRGLSFEIAGLPSNGQTGYMFYQSSISAIGTIDLSYYTSTNNVSSMFNTVSLKTIKNLIPPKCAMGATCWQSGLINLTVGGEIVNDMNLSRCQKLTKESIKSVINALSSTVSGKTLTLSQKAVDVAFEILDLAEDGTVNNYVPGYQTEEWAELVATKTNWTINLV